MKHEISGVIEKDGERFDYEATIFTGEDAESRNNNDMVTTLTAQDGEEVDYNGDFDKCEELDELALDDAHERLLYTNGHADDIKDDETLDEYLGRMAKVWHPEEAEICDDQNKKYLAEKIVRFSESESKHTAGPWTYRKGHGSGGLYHFIGQPENAVCMTIAGGDEEIANARLIAAAPELLAALEGAEKALRLALPFLPADKEACFCGEWIDEVKEAIRKAKGGAQ